MFVAIFFFTIGHKICLYGGFYKTCTLHFFDKQFGTKNTFFMVLGWPVPHACVCGVGLLVDWHADLTTNIQHHTHATDTAQPRTLQPNTPTLT